jgi:hypothetical protein
MRQAIGLMTVNEGGFSSCHLKGRQKNLRNYIIIDITLAKKRSVPLRAPSTFDDSIQ